MLQVGHSLYCLVIQEFNTVKGRKYTVRFGLAGHPGSRGETKDVIISAGDFKKKFTSPAGKEAAKVEWKTFTFNFTATDKRTTLRFESDSKTPFGAYLDNVWVVPAAE